MGKSIKFKIVCPDCGSQNVETEADESFGFDGDYNYSEYNGTIILRCIDCGATEFIRRD